MHHCFVIVYEIYLPVYKMHLYSVYRVILPRVIIALLHLQTVSPHFEFAQTCCVKREII